MKEGVHQNRTVACLWLAQAAETGSPTIFGSGYVRNGLVVAVDPIPIILSLGYHRSEGPGHALACRRHGIDREPETPISECDKTDGLHDSRVVEAVATHR